jgi:hypothetical protein
MVFKCLRWFWFDELEKALNKNTINLGFHPSSSFSFTRDRESWFAIHSNLYVMPWRMELGINKSFLLKKKKIPVFHQVLKVQASLLPRERTEVQKSYLQTLFIFTEDLSIVRFPPPY